MLSILIHTSPRPVKSDSRSHSRRIVPFLGSPWHISSIFPNFSNHHSNHPNRKYNTGKKRIRHDLSTCRITRDIHTETSIYHTHGDCNATKPDVEVTSNGSTLMSTETNMVCCSREWLKEYKYENKDSNDSMVILILSGES
jgi:hypothetical protein